MPHILLIEDDRILRRSLHLSLAQSGYKVTDAVDGGQGLSAFAEQSTDLVITDLVMPDVEGIETIRKIRKLSPRVPIIAISGYGRNAPGGYLRAAKSLGASEILAKPLHIEVLLAAVARLLGSAATTAKPLPPE